jgi:hypothetical protein
MREGDCTLISSLNLLLQTDKITLTSCSVTLVIGLKAWQSLTVDHKLIQGDLTLLSCIWSGTEEKRKRWMAHRSHTGTVPTEEL